MSINNTLLPVSRNAFTFEAVQTSKAEDYQRMSSYTTADNTEAKFRSTLAAPTLTEEEIEQKLESTENKAAFLAQRATEERTPPSAKEVVIPNFLFGQSKDGLDRALAMLGEFVDVVIDERWEHISWAGFGLSWDENGNPSSWKNIFSGPSRESTPENPIHYVVSNLSGNWSVYRVNVNMVDPRSATHEEMQAFFSHEFKNDEVSRFWSLYFLNASIQEPNGMVENIPGANGNGFNFLNMYIIARERQRELVAQCGCFSGITGAMYDSLVNMVDRMIEQTRGLDERAVTQKVLAEQAQAALKAAAEERKEAHETAAENKQEIFDTLMEMADRAAERTAEHAERNRAINAQRAPYNSVRNFTPERRTA